MKNEQVKKDNWLVAYLKGNPLQVTLQLIGVGILVLNLFLANKLNPLVQGLGEVVKRVDAMEHTLNETAGKASEITVVQTNIEFIREDVVEIKESVQRIEDALFVVPR